MTHFVNVEPHHHKSTDKNNTVNKVINSELHRITNCTTLYHILTLYYII